MTLDPEGRSDEELMLAVRDGDLDALGPLFERHHEPLWGYLVKLTGNRTAAEDITQTVFERMLKYRHTYREQGTFLAWMYRMARSASLDYRRKAGSGGDAAIDTLEPVDQSPHAADSAALCDDQEFLMHALARLDRDDREVLLLARFEELSQAEIARLLDCSIGAVKSRTHRALQALRETYFSLREKGVA